MLSRMLLTGVWNGVRMAVCMCLTLAPAGCAVAASAEHHQPVAEMSSPTAAGPRAGRTVNGTWEAGSFTNLNAYCRQSWNCVRPPGYYPPGCTVTPTTYTNGTCSADGGPPDSCNSCVAGQPSQPCQVVCP